LTLPKVKDGYICIHGHFYQPPRENPWYEAIDTEESAFPFHDWNERIALECYQPNAYARILDEKGKILEIINNYSSISFNYWSHAPSLAGKEFSFCLSEDPRGGSRGSEKIWSRKCYRTGLRPHHHAFG